ncbi:Ref family recombination enhancement nuclease, partial [Escherichia coli]|uniref:Ref family recombination enhancement nuclease n=1 Tax=Escherichia coli TaxID=562 RepID=UPI00201E51FA
RTSLFLSVCYRRNAHGTPRWHHQHAAPAEVREKYPWLVPVHADGVVGGKKEFTLLNKSEMELLADAYEMANIMH